MHHDSYRPPHLLTMNSRELTRIASLHLHTRPYFGGCVAADCLPVKVAYYPIFYICNSDRWYQRGSHWLLIMFRAAHLPPEFFDSFGREPIYYNKLIADFLTVNGGNGGYNVSSRKVQTSDSAYCGYYCLTVADYFSQGHNLSTILTLFDDNNLPRNDRLVQAYVNSHMKRIQWCHWRWFTRVSRDPSPNLSSSCSNLNSCP